MTVILHLFSLPLAHSFKIASKSSCSQNFTSFLSSRSLNSYYTYLSLLHFSSELFIEFEKYFYGFKQVPGMRDVPQDNSKRKRGRVEKER